MTTADNVTDEQIVDLRTEATWAGDDEQVDICTAALEGDAEARTECARVIAEAEAQATE